MSGQHILRRGDQAEERDLLQQQLKLARSVLFIGFKIQSISVQFYNQVFFIQTHNDDTLFAPALLRSPFGLQ